MPLRGVQRLEPRYLASDPSPSPWAFGDELPRLRIQNKDNLHDGEENAAKKKINKSFPSIPVEWSRVNFQSQ